MIQPPREYHPGISLLCWGTTNVRVPGVNLGNQENIQKQGPTVQGILEHRRFMNLFVLLLHHHHSVIVVGPALTLAQNGVKKVLTGAG